ncbi:DNA repair/transcription protein mms19 [Cyphellophora attinorum]|uniref:MMS19 nucleotide excision repair protein n=1 Tax=Cyphellophora attinorum TaxID=1664694 RepID=A0A0N1P1R8_9EURO|nr:DNA repair/transcription protein mms19 [Phialophora attinorum]KPI45325.1 DNA repair/transcription protein mms19 [Phialophora attinorum]
MAASDTRDYVLAFESNKDSAAQIAAATAKKLESRQTTLIEVVQSLGEYINDEDAKIRTRAVSYLTAIISSLPRAFLSRQQIDVLCDFLCARIEDGGALEGLSKLQSLDRFNDTMAQTVVKAVIDHFSDLQSLGQAARYKVLQLLNELMERHRKGVRDMGDQSLIGIAAVVSGEKDPRNLMLVFSMLRVIMVEWDISKHSDIMFDSVYAYFPITFRPPPNDPYGITAQDLKDRLRDCIASTGALAPHSIPNLIERLDATSVTVKRDVLQALAACALNYDPETIVKYSNPLWESVKFEILQAQEPELADEALVVIKNIAACISDLSGATPVTVPLFTYLKPIATESLDHLKQPASRQANASGDILKAAASASIRAHTYITEKVGPSLMTTLQDSDGILQQRAILEVTNKLFEAAIEVYGSRALPTSRHSGNPENALGQLKDNLVAVYSQALMATVKEEVSFRLTAAKGLLLFAKMRSILDDSEVGLFVQYFDDIVLKEESYGKDELKQVAIAPSPKYRHSSPASSPTSAYQHSWLACPRPKEMRPMLLTNQFSMH